MTKDIVILGAGTAGTMVANHLASRLPTGWTVTVIDPEAEHLYQPGLLFLPFGARDEKKMLRPRARTLRPAVRWLRATVKLVDRDAKRVILGDGTAVRYDLLVIASGSRIRPEETEGMMGGEWRKSIHDFYTLEGAQALRDALAKFEGGRLVVNVVEMPIKCPVAPLEFLFLADEFFTRRGIRDRVELVYATPLDGAFTKPIASKLLGSMLTSKGIRVETEFSAGSVDAEGHLLRSWDDRETPYDLLVTIPTHSGAALIGESALGNDMDFVPTEPNTLLVKGRDDMFALGDATDIPASKAGSVAHFQSAVVVENILRTIGGRSLGESFDGHTNCFIESGWDKAVLIDFNYTTEPLPGQFPLPAIGPMTLLGESRINHWGKLGFRWLYWNFLLPGRSLPVSNRMSMLGKITTNAQAKGEA